MTLQEEQLRQAIRELVPDEKDQEILWRGIEEYALLVSSRRATEVVERLKEANSLLRSAYSIAKREGIQTNWEAFRGQVKKELDLELPIINTLHPPECCQYCHNKEVGTCIKFWCDCHTLRSFGAGKIEDPQ